MSVSLDSNENKNIVIADGSNDGAEKQLTVPSSDRDEEPKPTMSIGQLILTFIIGLTADLSQPYVRSPAFTDYIALPCFDPAPDNLIRIIASLLGTLFVPFLMSRFSAEVSVTFCASLQFLAALFFWRLPYPFNNYFGTFVYFFGNMALILVYISLFSRLEPKAIRYYMGGITLGTLFGMTIILLLGNIGAGKTAYMLILCIFPGVNIISFYFLDRSHFRQTKNGDNHNGDVNAGEEKEVSNILLSTTEMLSALKEMAYRYYMWYFSFELFQDIWDLISSPSLQSSSLSYAGFHTKTEIFLEVSQIGTISSVLIAVVGISIMTPLGRIIQSTLSPYYMWVPTTILGAVTITSMVGLQEGAFPPLSTGWLYFFSIMVPLLGVIKHTFTFMSVPSDKTITPKYREFQAQSLFISTNIIGFIFSLFSVLWYSGYVRTACDANYQDVYTTENVTCSYYSDQAADGSDC